MVQWEGVFFIIKEYGIAQMEMEIMMLMLLLLIPLIGATVWWLHRIHANYEEKAATMGMCC